MKKNEIGPLAAGIAAGLKSAIAHAKGTPDKGTPDKATVEHIVMVPDVKAIQETLHLSQQDFATSYGIPLATLKGWEQGRRRLDTTAIAYLRTIARFPKQARRAQKMDIPPPAVCGISQTQNTSARS